MEPGAIDLVLVFEFVLVSYSIGKKQTQWNQAEETRFRLLNLSPFLTLLFYF